MVSSSAVRVSVTIAALILASSIAFLELSGVRQGLLGGDSRNRSNMNMTRGSGWRSSPWAWGTSSSTPNDDDDGEVPVGGEKGHQGSRLHPDLLGRIRRDLSTWATTGITVDDMRRASRICPDSHLDPRVGVWAG